MFWAQRAADHHGYVVSSAFTPTMRRLSAAYQVDESPRLADLTVTTAYGFASLNHDGVQNSKSSPAPNAALSAAAADDARDRARLPPIVATWIPFTESWAICSAASYVKPAVSDMGDPSTGGRRAGVSRHHTRRRLSTTAYRVPSAALAALIGHLRRPGVSVAVVRVRPPHRPRRSMGGRSDVRPRTPPDGR